MKWKTWNLVMPFRGGYWRKQMRALSGFSQRLRSLDEFVVGFSWSWFGIGPFYPRIDKGVRTWYSKHNSIGISFAVPVNPQIRIGNQQNRLSKVRFELSSSCPPEIPPSESGKDK